jgi:hypothetical protein
VLALASPELVPGGHGSHRPDAAGLNLPGVHATHAYGGVEDVLEARIEVSRTLSGLAAAKAAALRINVNIHGCGVVAPPMHAPFRTPLLPPLLLSHNLPFPRVH